MGSMWAVVLAAGASERMGRPKLDLPLDGETVIGRTIDAMLACPFERVRVVVSGGGPPAVTPRDRVEVVENPRPAEGMASSIRSGMKEIPDTVEAVAITLGDKPLVEPDTIRALIRAFEQGEADVVYPVHETKRGHPVIWGRALFDDLRKLRGEHGAKSLLEREDVRARALDVDDLGVRLDIDTPRDYARAREYLQEKDGLRRAGGGLPTG